MWEGLLGGLGKFASSGLGQAAIGAGLGYGADRLSGGKGGIGALAGGALGGLNALSSGGNFMGDAYTGSMADQAVTGMGGLLGGTGKQTNGINMNYAPTGDMVKDMATRQVPGATNLANNSSMLGGISDFGTKYGGLVKGGTDIANAYGSYQSNMANRDNTKAQMNYIQNLQRQQDLENEYQRTARAQTQAGANAGFNNSVLGSSSNYYSA
jgi:hypothetical protein